MGSVKLNVLPHKFALVSVICDATCNEENPISHDYVYHNCYQIAILKQTFPNHGMMQIGHSPKDNESRLCIRRMLRLDFIFVQRLRASKMGQTTIKMK